MRKIMPLQLVFLIVILFITAFLAAGQVITFAWLSSIPERAIQLESLEIKFWSYAVLSVSLFMVDVVLLVHLVKQISERRSMQKNKF